MRLRAIIIDDEDTGINALTLLIEKHVPDVMVVAHCERPANAIALIEAYKPDIVFLDISMPEMDGFELLEKLEWKSFSLVFTTAYQEYALKALKLNASDYLLKPVYHKELLQAVDRIKEQQQTKQFDYRLLNEISQFNLDKLGVNLKDGVEYINPADIISLQSRSNNTIICLKNGREILSLKRLREFEALLCNSSLHFCGCTTRSLLTCTK